MTDAERKLWAALRISFADAHWRHQVPFGPFIADFCSHRAKLIVELDGGQHRPETDAARTRFLESQGYRVLRFWNNDVIENVEGVVTAIADALLPLPLGEGRGEGDALSESTSPSPFRAAPSLPLPAGEGI